MLEVVPEELAPGLVAGDRFCLERRLGAGGMGEVWAARHIVTKRRVALKFLKPSRAADARSRARIALEARAASAVHHPNVVQIHDVGELDSGLPFLVMDLLEGETLASRLARDTRLSPAEVARVMLPVVDAVRAAHAVGVVHRDLKPENVFLSSGEQGEVEVKVLDFGIAKLLDSVEEGAGPPLTATGEVLGSSLYMAPEQIYGESDVDGRADVWALGVILYEVLSGTRPTQRATSGQVLKAITIDEIVPLTRARSDVPPALARVVMRMLSRDRALRPTLDVVAEVLARPDGARSRMRWASALLVPAALAVVYAHGDPASRPSDAPHPRDEVQPLAASNASRSAPSNVEPAGDPPAASETPSLPSAARPVRPAHVAPSSSSPSVGTPTPSTSTSASGSSRPVAITPPGSDVVLTLDRK